MRFKISLYINYIVFAILLNSVGIIILKSQEAYGVDELAASILELFKDMPIAIVSFALASFLPRLGYKNAMLAALALVAVACIYMYYGNSFNSAKILFACVGTAFGLIKMSVYSAIGVVSNNEAEHNALMSSLEGVFMFGVASTYFIFPLFNSDEGSAWLNVYPFLAVLSVFSFIFLWFSPYEHREEAAGNNIAEDFKSMWKLLAKVLVMVFVVSAFLFVMIEQGIMSWLPTFNKRVLNLPSNVAIMMSSILAISLGVGRILAGYLSKKYHWSKILLVCIILAMLMVVFVLPKTVSAQVQTISSIKDIPLIGYAFPLVGLFIAPIYPLLNSAVLSALPKSLHSSMSGLIIIFSALGGTLGSRIIGYLFKIKGAGEAFYYLLIPMMVLFASVVILKRLTSLQQKA